MTRKAIIPFLLVFSLPASFADAREKEILFLGDSLTAGYHLSPDVAYPALIASKIKEAGLPYNVRPAGVSGDTSAGGLRRINWLLKKPVDILVLALGANDGLRGQDLRKTRENLQGIIDATRAKNPDVKVVVAGMKLPPNLGERYTKEFEQMFVDLAEENEAVLIPFLLEGVAANPKLNLSDRIHPNEEGHKILAETVWVHLKETFDEEPETAEPVEVAN